MLKTTHPEATTALLDGMQHFSMGFSWGGFESLILAHEPKAFTSLRSVANLTSAALYPGSYRCEDVEDLIADLEAGFARYNQILHA